ncbi:MAG: FAD-dependent monooxygenase [Phycisphaerales bacterium]|nr:FAD-dependent monooxygenase [Phycisphaerales bacterium]
MDPNADMAGRHWDAVVIGAGPAGALAAREIARRGRSVLLVEKARFPRWKVCGACLGVAGVETLQRVGLGGLLGRIGARPVVRTRLVWRGRSVLVPMRGMVAVSRGALDAALVLAAREAGAHFVDQTHARVFGDGSVVVDDQTVPARSVVLAGGIRSAGRDGEAGAAVSKDAWIGLGVVAPLTGAGSLPDDELTMLVGRRGYLGRVVTEDGMANWAAAVDPAFVRSCGSPGEAMRAICDEAGLGVTAPGTGWVGTPALTRSTPAQRGRLYRVGDAAGYVEPITGEGMSWAMLGAAALAPVLDRALASDRHAGAWARTHAGLFRWRRARCRVVSRGLRSPLAMHAAMAALGAGRPARAAVVGRLIGGHA